MIITSILEKLFMKSVEKMMGKNLEKGVWYVIKTVPFIGAAVLMFLEYFELRSIVHTGIEKETFVRMSESLTDECIVGFVVWVVYAVFNERLSYLVARIRNEKNKDYFPVKHTVEHVCELLFSVVLSIKTVGDLVVYVGNAESVGVANVIIYGCVLVQGAWNYACRIYVVNENRAYCRAIKYTDFWDCEGKRIPQDWKVVYRNRLYDLFCEEGKWWLSARDTRFMTNDVALEDAVMDKDGKLRVYQYGVGEMR